MTDKVLDLARTRFKIAIDAESENRGKELDDIKFLAASPDDHWQWPTEVYKSRTQSGQEGGARPCLTINKLPQHHRQVTNEQRMNRPQIRVQPVDDKGDPEVADVLNGIARHIQVASEADLAYDTACDAQVAHGVGYFRLLTEYCDERSFDQDIRIKPVRDRFKVYYDPHIQHPAGEDAKWAFIVEDLPKAEYEAEYGDHPVDWQDAAIGDKSDWFPTKDTVRVAEYFALEQETKKLYLWGNGETSLEGEQLPPGVTAVEKPQKERTTKITKCIWRKINGQKELKKTELPTRFIPVVRVVGNEWIIEGKPVVSGITRNAKDAQRMYNYNASMEVEQNALAPKAPFVGMAEQFEGHEEKWGKANTTSYAFLPYNAVVDETTGQIVTVNPPARAIQAMPQSAHIQAKLAASDDIKATTGQYDASLGQKSNETSGKAIMARQREGDVGTFHYVDNLARAIRHAGRIMLDMIPKVYDTKRIARIVGEDGTADHVVIDPDIQGAYQEVVDPNTQKKLGKVFNLGVGKYDVVVNVGPSFTSKRAEAAEFLTNAVQAAKDPATANVLTYLALKSQDWAGADEAVDMLKKLLPPQVVEAEEGEEGADIPPQVQAMVQQMKQTVGQLTGQLEAAKQAVAERDQTAKDLQAQIKGKNTDALAKMYEADKKAMAEMSKARADVAIAQGNAVTAAREQPGNPEVAQVVEILAQVAADLDSKIVALAEATAAIRRQLDTFEIAGRMPVAPDQAAAPVAP